MNAYFCDRKYQVIVELVAMRADTAVRTGPSTAECDQLFIPGKLVPTTSAKALFCGVTRSSSIFDVAFLRGVSEKNRLLALYMFPDGLPGNRLVMTQLEIQLPNAAIFQAWCTSHVAQLVWDDGSKPIGFTNPLYCVMQLLGNSATQSKVHSSVGSVED